VRQCPADRQTLFLSATLAGESGRVAARYTREPVRREHVPAPDPAAAKVEHRFVEVEHASRVESLVRELSADRDRALVFVRTKRGADRLVKRLGHHGVEAVAMHGNKTQGQRERALASFESGDINTLVATDVAARGIDVDGISHVINYDAPEDRDAYVHRVGRTGRAGRGGIGITFLTADERGAMSRLAQELGIAHGIAAGPSGQPAGAKGTPRGSAGGGSRRPRTAEAPRSPRVVASGRSSGRSRGRRRVG
jgi:superfamily II DNA/RNA helicase